MKSRFAALSLQLQNSHCKAVHADLRFGFAKERRFKDLRIKINLTFCIEQPLSPHANLKAIGNEVEPGTGGLGALGPQISV